MRILHVTKKYPGALGGDAEVVYNLENQQKKAGHEVSILTSRCQEIKDKKNIYKYGFRDKASNLDKITIKRLSSLLVLYFKSRKLLKTIRPDVIHTHSIDMAFFISFAARKYNIPVVHTFHVITFNDSQQSVLRRKSELFLLRVTKPKKIFILNPAVSADFKKKGFINTLFIPNGVNANYWLQHKYNKSNHFTLIAVGRLEKQKGFEYLIDAAYGLKKSNISFVLNIVGDGSLHEKLNKNIIDLGLDRHVFLLGQKDQKQLREEYALSDIFILSSLWEGMPLSLLEAWSSGLATVCTNVGSIPYIYDGASLLVKPENSRSLQNGIDKLIADRKIRSDLGRKARVKALEYDWAHISEKILKTYEIYQI